GDVNKDWFTDFYFASPSADNVGYLALSNGKEHFQTTRTDGGATASQFLDYDNDGLLDLVSVTGGGLRVLRNTSSGWENVSSKAASAIKFGDARMMAAGDIDGDGDTDIVFGAPGNLKVARNDG